jgi:hypothetical protein
MSDDASIHGSDPNEEEVEAAAPAREEERALFVKREKCLKDHIFDLEKAYAIAMDLVKAAPKETLIAVGATCRLLATQDDHPNTRDLVAAILQRASVE